MHWLRLLNANPHIVTITVCAYLVGEHLFLFALYTERAPEFTRLFIITFQFLSPCVFCWLDHSLTSHPLMSARAHDLTIVNNKSFVIACPRLSTSDSSVNKFPFQNNRAGCTDTGSCQNLLRQLLVLLPQPTHLKQAFIHLSSLEVILTRVKIYF